MKKKTVVKYRKPLNINIGVVIFAVLFVYLIICVFQYFTSKQVSPYEVQEGSIAQNDSYTGFAIRNEKIIYAPKSGYINYFSKSDTKVGAKSLVYSLDQSGTLFTKTDSDTDSELSSSDILSLGNSIQLFSYQFDDNKFYDTYTFKDSLKASIMECQTMDQDGVIDTSKLNLSNIKELTLYYAEKPGVILYTIDGYEDITLNEFTKDLMDESSYSPTNLKLNEKVSKDEPVYKLVTGEKWKMIVSISDELAKKLSQEDYIDVTFKNDDNSAWAACKINEINGNQYLVLSFTNSMIRYAQERYIDIEFSVDTQTGLKIPNSSITKKDFWVIPNQYLTKGGNSNGTGVLLLDSSGSSEFQNVSIFNQTDDYSYVSCNSLEKGSIILEPSTQNQYTIKETKSIKGVYNINKGYAVFRQISILTSNEDYTIIEKGTDYGIGIYDHIALDAQNVKEGDIINE